ncbi:hypothetical protein GM3708_1486 [Geminocystis sp. NIES-3708]|uniref:DUF2656 family protein n=1 Tax=Geminocystis sp. NIES-3708 TaxID=1615909 RepID=UPI0005FC40BF|nr:DUF2656 family protein [Geminocystis sp. NIES-3708]BAQ61080.1 hypothetical protein GM3708_1486 [Geminocystis sp. NIES-3708]
MSHRFFLSHNYSISENIAPPLSSDTFCQVFHEYLPSPWQVIPLSHPHWRCQVITDAPVSTVADSFVKVLVDYRQNQLQKKLPYRILALGGVKNTPANSSDVNTLQQGDWGVDIVEVENAEKFLQSINWDNLIAGRLTEDIFKVISK